MTLIDPCMASACISNTSMHSADESRFRKLMIALFTSPQNTGAIYGGWRNFGQTGGMCIVFHMLKSLIKKELWACSQKCKITAFKSGILVHESRILKWVRDFRTTCVPNPLWTGLPYKDLCSFILILSFLLLWLSVIVPCMASACNFHTLHSSVSNHGPRSGICILKVGLSNQKI